MTLRAISRADADTAVALLAEGFPALSARTWQDSIDRIFDYIESTGREFAGYFETTKAGDVGICLAIPAVRNAYIAPPRSVINLSCLYMRPGNEWMTPLFLRRVMAQDASDYSDLTASTTIRQLNRKIGFKDRSNGTIIAPLAVSACRASPGVRLVRFDAISRDALAPHHYALLEQHHRLDRIVLGVEHERALHPLILTESRRKGVPGARIVLASSRELVRAALGPLARYLLVRGYLFLDFDGKSKDGFPEALFWTNTPPVQMTGDWDHDAIDHTFSELVFIPPV